MANIIVDLTREMRRVEALYPSMAVERMQEAQRTVHFAHVSMTMNSLEGMQEALDDLREIKAEQKP